MIQDESMAQSDGDSPRSSVDLEELERDTKDQVDAEMNS